MADWNTPTNASAYTGVLTTLNEKVANAAKMDYTGDTNLPTGAIRLNSRQLQSWNGSSWVRAAFDPAPWGGTSGGSANAQTLTLDPAWASYLTGVPVFFSPGFTNTGAATLNVNGLGTKAVQYMGAALVGAELVAGVETAVVYDGTQLELLRHGGGWASWTPTYGASGSMTLTSVSTLLARYQRHGSRVDFSLQFTGTTGGTASNTLTASLPVTSSAQSGMGLYVIDGSAVAGYATIGGGGTNLSVSKYDTSNFGLGSGRGAIVTGSYSL
ncbi:MAG: hypothetical protein K2X87_09200 [Gemmataceae bacterium]|nr:hypothetical protein [Gemmataceae bacterium]